MLRDFTKLQTLIVVAQEKNFSKASAKLGISQPAVTQQIKFIEQYFKVKIIIRKKNGVQLTKEGETLLLIAQDIEKNLHKYHPQIMRMIQRKDSIRFACSYTIGHFIFPKCLSSLQQKVYPNIEYSISTSLQAIEDLKNGLCEIALTESYIPDKSITYREWLEDELVLISTQNLPRIIHREELYSYTWIGLEMTKQTIPEVYKYLKTININKDNLNVKMRFDSLDKIKQFMLEHRESKTQYIAFLPYIQVKNELQNRLFYSTKILGVRLKRKLYLAHLKKTNDPLMDSIIEYIIFNNKISLH